MTTVAERGVAAWHAVLAFPSAAALDPLLAENVVFHSPIVHTPQRGKSLAKIYLMAAFQVLAADAPETSVASPTSPPSSASPTSPPSVASAGAADESRANSAPPRSVAPRRFRYVREVVGERDAVLEFTTEIDGITINGVDMIRFDEDARVVDFKVMLRPLKAIQMVHAAMGRMLEISKKI
jgi:hypothetical protein